MAATLLPLVLLLALPGCASLMDAVAGTLSDPGVQEGLIQVAGSAATGNWTGTLWGVGTIAAILAYRRLARDGSGARRRAGRP